jgi:hypothetical protein
VLCSSTRLGLVTGCKPGGVSGWSQHTVALGLLLFGRLFSLFTNLILGCHAQFYMKFSSLLKLFGCKHISVACQGSAYEI